MGDCEDDEILTGTFRGLVGGGPVQVRNVRDGLAWGWREFSDGVDIPTKLAFGARFIGAKDMAVVLRPGERRTFVFSARSWAKTARPMEYARSRARWMADSDVEALRREHLRWWQAF